MASASTKTPKTLAKISGTRWWLAAAAALYVASVAATVSPFRGDALFYISDALAVRAGTGHAESLWEFGHLLWRPLVYISSPFLLKLSPGGVAWSPNLTVLYGLIWIDRLARFAAVLLMADRSEEHTSELQSLRH